MMFMAQEFQRTTFVFTQQQQKAEATNEQLEDRIHAAEARAAAADAAKHAYAERVAELEADVAELEEELAAAPVAGSPPELAAAPAPRLEEAEAGVGGEEHTESGVAAMGQGERLEALGRWPGRAGRQLLLKHCQAEAIALGQCCETVADLLAKLESARISRLSAQHRDIDVADILMLSNTRLDAVSAQVKASLPGCKEHGNTNGKDHRIRGRAAERTIWELLLDTTTQRRTGNDYKWRLLKPAHDKELEHKAASAQGQQPTPAAALAGGNGIGGSGCSSGGGGGPPTGPPAVRRGPASAEAMAVVASNSEMGFLLKRGAINPAWNKRWFMLTGHALCYFKQVNDDSPRGIFSMVEYRPVDEPVGAKPFSFRLVNPAGRSSDYVMLAAESAEDKDKWIEILGCTAAALGQS